jgi:hypothetical protein
MKKKKFSSSILCDADKTFLKQLLPYFSSTRKLLNELKNEHDNVVRPNLFQIQMTPKMFNCKTFIIQNFFTLENAKFLYLNFIYNFFLNTLI